MKLLKELLLLSICLLACLLLICFSPQAKVGVMQGLKICGNVLIPSMFPFLVLSNFINLSSVSATLGKGLGPLFSRLFHLPENVTSVILLSLSSGYPTGAVMTSSLLEHQEIDRETAARLLKFCFNSGLPFAVTAVGSIMLGSPKLGFFLYLSNLCSALLIGIIDGRRYPKNAREYHITYAMNLTDALSEGVKKGTSAMINVCAYVILFSALDGLLGGYITYRDYLVPLMEITAGSLECAGDVSLPLLAFYLGFGGVCIHLQLAFAVRQAGMRFRTFFKYRLLQGGLSYLLCHLLLLLFPSSQTVFSNLTETGTRLFSISVPVTIMMLVMSVVLIIDIDNQKKIC